jgi:REJ domain
MTAPKEFGTSCSDLLAGGEQRSKVTVRPNSLVVGRSYAFTVVATASDGRSDTKTATVTPADLDAADVEIVRIFSVYDVGVVLDGTLKARSACRAAWTVSDTQGALVKVESLTPQSTTFSAEDAIQKIPYSLSIESGLLSAGKTYIFRLTGYLSDRENIASFAEVALTIRIPPYGGTIEQSPSTGVSLSTSFDISTSRWITDSSNLPLSYTYFFKVSDLTPFLVLRSASTLPYAKTRLPGGVKALNYLITLKVKATDIFIASGNTTSEVQVLPPVGVDIPEFLTTSLTQALSQGSVDRVFQTVNSVSLLFHGYDRSVLYYLLYSTLVVLSYLVPISYHRWRRPSTSPIAPDRLCALL